MSIVHDAAPAVDASLAQLATAAARLTSAELSVLARWLDAFTLSHSASCDARALGRNERQARLTNMLPHVAEPVSGAASALALTAGVYAYRIPLEVSDPAWCVICVGSTRQSLYDCVVATQMRSMQRAVRPWFYVSMPPLGASPKDEVRRDDDDDDSGAGATGKDVLGSAWRNDAVFIEALRDEWGRVVDDAARPERAARRLGNGGQTGGATPRRRVGSDSPPRAPAVISPSTGVTPRRTASGSPQRHRHTESAASPHGLPSAPRNTTTTSSASKKRGAPAAVESSSSSLRRAQARRQCPVDIAHDVLLLLRDRVDCVARSVDALIRALGVPLSGVLPTDQNVTHMHFIDPSSGQYVRVDRPIGETSFQAVQNEGEKPPRMKSPRTTTEAAPFDPHGTVTSTAEGCISHDVGHRESPPKRVATRSPSRHVAGKQSSSSSSPRAPPPANTVATNQVLWERFLRGALAGESDNVAAWNDAVAAMDNENDATRDVLSSPASPQRLRPRPVTIRTPRSASSPRSGGAPLTPQHTLQPGRNLRFVSSPAGRNQLNRGGGVDGPPLRSDTPTLLLIPTAAFECIQALWMSQKLPSLGSLAFVIDQLVSHFVEAVAAASAGSTATAVDDHVHSPSGRNADTGRPSRDPKAISPAARFSSGAVTLPDMRLSLPLPPRVRTRRNDEDDDTPIKEASEDDAAPAASVTAITPTLTFRRLSLWKGHQRSLLDVRSRDVEEQLEAILERTFTAPSVTQWPEGLEKRLILPSCFLRQAAQFVTRVHLENVELLREIRHDCFAEAKALTSLRVVNAPALLSVGHDFAAGCPLLQRVVFERCVKLRCLGDRFLFRCTSLRLLKFDRVPLDQVGEAFVAEGGKLPWRRRPQQRSAEDDEFLSSRQDRHESPHSDGSCDDVVDPQPHRHHLVGDIGRHAETGDATVGSLKPSVATRQGRHRSRGRKEDDDCCRRRIEFIGCPWVMPPNTPPIEAGGGTLPKFVLDDELEAAELSMVTNRSEQQQRSAQEWLVGGEATNTSPPRHQSRLSLFPHQGRQLLRNTLGYTLAYRLFDFVTREPKENVVEWQSYT